MANYKHKYTRIASLFRGKEKGGDGRKRSLRYNKLNRHVIDQIIAHSEVNKMMFYRLS